MSVLKRRLHALAVKLGVSNSQIFGKEAPHPNPHSYETTPNGIPLVPDEDVKSTMFGGSPTIFSGGMVYAGAGDDQTFLVRSDMTGVSLRKGDLFAFANANENRPALVYEVVEKNDYKGLSITAQDVGYLKSSWEETEQEAETIELTPQSA